MPVGLCTTRPSLFPETCSDLGKRPDASLQRYETKTRRSSVSSQYVGAAMVSSVRAIRAITNASNGWSSKPSTVSQIGYKIDEQLDKSLALVEHHPPF